MSILETENDIQNAICEYLEIRGYFFWRQNTPQVYDTQKGVFRRVPKYGLKGIPDIIVITDGLFWGLEVKKKDTYQSPEQKEFQQLLETKGKGKYNVVRSIQDVQDLGF